ncbi:hypothetical protein [Nocardioides sp.]|uniref:hypothetical protein n=1 Tax=Nocardioides sp. TaxID=35761 RepID=UPI003519B0BA
MALPRREQRDLAPPRLRARRRRRDHHDVTPPPEELRIRAEVSEPASHHVPDDDAATGGGDHDWLFADLSTDPTAAGPTGAETAPAPPAAPRGRRRGAARTARSHAAPEGPRVIRRRSTVRRPAPRIAAAATGLLVGIVLVGLTRSGITVCEAARDVPSCGNGPGLLAQTVIVMLAYVAGRALLRMWQVADPDTIGFLGLGGACAVVLIFLTPLVGSWVMAPILPLLCALTYLGGWWLTTAVPDTPSRGR